MIKSFDHVAITVKDLDKTIDWYVRNLGFSVVRNIEIKERGLRIAFLEAGGNAMLEFFGFIDPEKAVEGPTLREEETGMKHISFFVDNVEELSLKLRTEGTVFTALTPKRAVFKDPNGILIEIRLP